jgi:heptosyltransferase-2
LIRLPNWVGDALMCTPALRRLRRRYSEAELVGLARPGIAPLLEGNPNLDELWAVDDRGRTGILDTFRRIRQGLFDHAVLFPNSFHSAALVRLAGVRSIRGYARDGRRLLLSDPVPFRPEDYSVHEVINYLRLAEDSFPGGGDGGSYPAGIRPGDPPLEYVVDPEDRANLAERLHALEIATDAPLLVLTPGAAYGTAKRWHPERFAEVAARLATHHALTVIAVGTEPEAETIESVCAGIRERAPKTPVHNQAGRFTLRLLGALLERASLHLTNDSGPMHISAALNTPLIAVFGSTDPVTTGPWTSRACLVRTFTECSPCLLRHCPIDHRCMERVSVNQVFLAAQGLLLDRDH